jgi:hypothetical protein
MGLLGSWASYVPKVMVGGSPVCHYPNDNSSSNIAVGMSLAVQADAGNQKSRESAVWVSLRSKSGNGVAQVMGLQ